MTGRFRNRLHKAYGGLSPVCLFCCLLFLVLPGLAGAESPEAYLEGLLAKAAQQQLASDPYWQLLLHYRPDLLGRRRSLVDDPRFFLAPTGKTDPAAELAADLRGFFSPPQPGQEHPRSRFPVRFAWLQERLGIDAARLPAADGGELQQALEEIAPTRAVLVFPAAHINNPASMFGHTLLRIDGRKGSALLANAINYAAFTTDKNGLVYAWKGLFGMYAGYYSIHPYYVKVQEYNDLEHRDLWEYRLNLTPAETRRLVLHVWELRDLASDYYFFDENCSYNLLFLLDVARPGAKLTARSWAWAIPSDTVRAVREGGFVDTVDYRPSQGTKTRHLAGLLTPDGRQAATELLAGAATPEQVLQRPLSLTDKAGALDLAVDLQQYRYLRKEVEQAEYQQRFMGMLRARSSLGQVTLPAPPRPTAPDQGHGTARMTVAGGERDGAGFAEVGWRFAYHDLLDADAGYVPGAQILFGDFLARWYPEEGAVRLERFRAVDIVSVSPRDDFYRPLSWRVGGGVEQILVRDGRWQPGGRLQSGGGLAWHAPAQGIFYLLGEADLLVVDGLQEGWGLGAGASVGLLQPLGTHSKLHLSARSVGSFLGDRHLRSRLEAGYNLRLDVNQSLELSGAWEQAFGGVRSTELRLAWKLYL